MRYALLAILIPVLGGCGPDAVADLSWIEETAADPSGPTLCYESISLPGGEAGAAPRDERIETPCPDQMTPEVVQSLQRALTARGLYGGPVTGVYGKLTSAAVESYQTPRGLPSSVLSLRTARELGLIAYQPTGSETDP